MQPSKPDVQDLTLDLSELMKALAGSVANHRRLETTLAVASDTPNHIYDERSFCSFMSKLLKDQEGICLPYEFLHAYVGKHITKQNIDDFQKIASEYDLVVKGSFHPVLGISMHLSVLTMITKPGK
jgi:hypothetical protein